MIKSDSCELFIYDLFFSRVEVRRKRICEEVVGVERALCTAIVEEVIEYFFSLIIGIEKIIAKGIREKVVSELLKSWRLVRRRGRISEVFIIWTLIIFRNFILSWLRLCNIIFPHIAIIIIFHRVARSRIARTNLGIVWIFWGRGS